MIPSNELRIGNWVLFEGLYCTVSGIFDTDTNEDKHPISLTPEILEQCGFVKREDGYVFQPELQNIEYRLVDFHGWIFSIGFFNWNNEITTIKYLHQLQNLFFALSDEELTVNL